MKRETEFIEVYRKGKVYQIEPLRVYALPAREAKIGFVVPKRIGKAVFRNRLKRRLAAAVRQNLSLFENLHLIFRFEKPNLPDDFKELENLVKRIAGEIHGQSIDSPT